MLANFVSQNRLGGDERVRTDDPLLAKQVSGVRSNHLSYEPMSLYSLCSGSCLASSGFARANLLGAYFQNLRN